jgi:hypothetical protein
MPIERGASRRSTIPAVKTAVNTMLLFTTVVELVTDWSAPCSTRRRLRAFIRSAEMDIPGRQGNGIRPPTVRRSPVRRDGYRPLRRAP